MIVLVQSLCRVMDFYNLLTMAKYPASILGIIFISDGWLKKMRAAKAEQDEQLPCNLEGISYRYELK